MRVLFVNGPSQDYCDRFFGWPTSLLYAIAPAVQAMDEGRLPCEYIPRIFDPLWYVDGLIEGPINALFAEQVADVDVVCASCTYDSYYPTMELLSHAKRLRPDITTVLGGPHVDAVAVGGAEPFGRSGVVDYWVAGDGEHVLEALLRGLAQGGVDKIDWRALAGRAVVSGPSWRAQTSGRPLGLSDLPPMPIKLADAERHRNDFDIFESDGEVLPTVQMIGQRGCVYQCTFCSERRDLAYPNARSIDSILAEVDLRARQGFKAIFFDDSTFGLNPNLPDLLKALGSTGLRFGCLNRFNHLTDPRIVEAYRAAGFTYFYCAIEQFNDDILRGVRKGQTRRTIEGAMRVLYDHGFQLGVSLLYGLPGETEVSMMTTLDYTREWVDKGLIRLVSESLLAYHDGTPAAQGIRLSFDRPAPHRGFPYDRFEEGQWDHPPHVTQAYVERLVQESEARFARVMVRRRHSWYARHGYTLDGVLSPLSAGGRILRLALGHGNPESGEAQATEE